MKKIVALLCVLALMFTLAGCLGKGSEIVNLSEGTNTQEIVAKKAKQGKRPLLTEEAWKSTYKTISERNEKYPDIELKSASTVFSLFNDISEKMYGKSHVYTLNPMFDSDGIILYLHGGAYVLNITSAHINFCDNLCSNLNMDVCIPLYSLAPEANYRDAYKLLNEVYDDLLKQNKPIYIMGDSAGGGLALGFTMDLKEHSKKLPEKIVLLSPCLDGTFSNPDIPKYEPKDLTVATYGAKKAIELWADGDDITDYHISPINGDLKGLPPIMVNVGTAETLYPDCLKFYNMCNKNDVICKLVVGENLWHVFPLSNNIDEAEESMDLIVEFLDD